ncbi:N-methyl-L-tryptophan oxidase [Erwinia tasmaniensis]|uniref:N-methyl-L-tryptophan oxidase n=1 Tax=Erwinia tasmaniensis (strain DSM 17950 / CFBP 7177 / CIP 109463 / NCPPB 4357 / Et1/99) TaxID=465817 RepID=B2VDJ0_ERWT9|nr:N-methyl-L-tryptophan oxidase [Erwinia tasmaniensis]CAO97101.1 N-methyl-L-tryptophan oxidase [Erwinia tasmaniensis Et1/99]
MVYDLIVVGSGSVGAAAGWYATQAGLKVLMIDGHHPPHREGSHHGESRLIRHAYGEGARYVPMVLRAQQLWDRLEQDSGERVMQRCGVLNLAPQQAEFIQNVMRSAEQFRLDVEILSEADVMQRWPQIALPNGYIGVFEPASGYLKAEVAVKSWIRLAREAGCAQLFNCPVNHIDTQNGLQTVATADGVYQARRLLLSAGTWVKTLCPELPVAPVRKVFAWHQADGRYSENNKFPAFTVEMPDGNHYYGFPADNNALKMGKHEGGQPIASAAERKPFGALAADGSELFSFIRQFLPGVGVCLRGEACTYDNSPDGDFIIDTLPGEPDRMVISGLSGHGFKFASVLGEIAAQFAQGRQSEFDLTPFSLSRFANDL